MRSKKLLGIYTALKDNDMPKVWKYYDELLKEDDPSPNGDFKDGRVIRWFTKFGKYRYLYERQNVLGDCPIEDIIQICVEYNHLDDMPSIIADLSQYRNIENIFSREFVREIWESSSNEMRMFLLTSEKIANKMLLRRYGDKDERWTDFFEERLRNALQVFGKEFNRRVHTDVENFNLSQVPITGRVKVMRLLSLTRWDKEATLG